MTTKTEDSLAFKAFLYCPVPGVDLVAGAAVYSATAAAEACADGVKGAVKEGLTEALQECQRGAITAGEAALRRQLTPMVSSLDSIASAIVGSVPPGAKVDPSGKQ